MQSLGETRFASVKGEIEARLESTGMNQFQEAPSFGVPGRQKEHLSPMDEVRQHLSNYKDALLRHHTGEVPDTHMNAVTDFIWELKPKFLTNQRQPIPDDEFAALIADMCTLSNIEAIVEADNQSITPADVESFRGMLVKSLTPVPLGQAPRWETLWNGEQRSTKQKLAARLLRMRSQGELPDQEERWEILGMVELLDEVSPNECSQITRLLSETTFRELEFASHLDPEAELKLLCIAAKKAQGQSEINFSETAKVLKTKDDGWSQTKLASLDTGLSRLSWAQICNDADINSVGPMDLSLEVRDTGPAKLVLIIQPSAGPLFEFLDAHALEIDHHNPWIKAACLALGVTTDVWDRGSDQEGYVSRLDSTQSSKTQALQKSLEELKRNREKPLVVLGIGSGSGLVEASLATNGSLDPDSTVIATDISESMVAASIKLARIVAGMRSEGIVVSKMLALNLDASQLLNAVETGQVPPPDMITMLSVLHEFASYLDNGTFGENTRNILEQSLLALADNGIMVIKDFVVPEKAEEIVDIIANETNDRLTPIQFFRDFVEGFVGKHLSAVRSLAEQVGNAHPGDKLSVPKWLAMELVAHYSWMKMGESPGELNERYGYCSVDDLIGFMRTIGEKIGVSLEIEVDVKNAEYEPHYQQGLMVTNENGNTVSGLVSNLVMRIKKLPREN